MNDQELERWLERALSEYRAASPRDGLEQRVLANLQTQPRAVGWWRWWWVVAAAMVVTAVGVRIHSHVSNQVEVANIQQKQVAPKVDSATLPAAESHTQLRPRSRAVHNKNVPRPMTQPSITPRLKTFPSRSGDDELVRLAVRFAEQHPEMAGQISREQNDFRQMAEAFTSPRTESSGRKSSEE
jgi:hypothetical protein